MKTEIHSTSKMLLYSVVAIIIGVLLRTTFKIAPGFEIVTALSIASGYFFNKKYLAFLVPLTIMLISDSIIGNTKIYLFTWSGFLLAPLLGILANKLSFMKLNTYLGTVTKGLGAGLVSTVVYFLWTNLGVVVITTMYTKDINGVIQSYINGLPFLKTQIVSTLIFIPLIFAITLLVLNYKKILYKTFVTKA